jgi:hypothetical protein
MVEDRAFYSFGRDEDVIAKRWTAPLPGGRTEADFARTKDDICCADAVAYVAYQSGVVDFVGQASFSAHGVDSYFPLPARTTAGMFRFVGLYSADNYKAGAEVPQDDFLPGDYFIYCRTLTNDGAPYRDPPRKRIEDWLANAPGKESACGNHINIYLGDFVEVGPDGNPVTNGGGVFQTLNGSWGKGAAGTYVVPIPIVGDFSSEIWGGWGSGAPTGTIIVHCRFIAIERLFGDSLGPPVRAIAPMNQSGGPPPPAPPVDPVKDMAEFWTRIDRAKAPYPVGQNLAWHQGVHVTISDLEAEHPPDVVAMAPGEVIAARAVGTTPQGDTGFVLLRHLLARDKKEVVDPVVLYGKDGKRLPMPPNIVPFFSLSMHTDAIDQDGLDPARDVEDVKHFSWVRAVRPLVLPKNMIPHSTPITLLALDGNDPAKGWVSLGQAPHPVAGDIDLGKDADALETISAGGETYYVLPQGSLSHREAWLDRPTGKPATGTLVFYNPRSKTVIPTGVQVGPSTFLHLDADPANPDVEHLSVVTVDGVDGVDFATVGSFTAPGVRKADVAGELTVIDGVLVLPAKATKLTIHVDAVGAGADRKLVGTTFAAPIALLIDADAEATRLAGDDADKRHHTTLGVKADAPPTKDVVFWLDLVPCVALAPGQKDAIEKELNGTQKQLARAADARLSRGASRLAVALVSADGAEWTLDTASSTLSPGTSPSLYTLLSLTPKKALAVETDPKGKALRDNPDGRLQPSGLAQAKLRALSVVAGPAKAPSRALVEIVFAVRASDADTELRKRVDAVKKVNELREAIAKDLRAGKVVDMRARFGNDLPPELRVDRVPIGRVGRIVGEPDAPPDQRGIHFEVFAGRPLLMDKDTPPPLVQNKVVRIPGSPWLGFEDTDPADLSAEIADKLLAELKALGLPGLDTRALSKRPDPTQPLKRGEWLDFCSANPRLLSRIVSVHESEWTADWAKAATAMRSRQKLQVDGKEDALDRVYKSLAELGAVKFTAEDKLSDLGAIVFHHPARLLEILRTRIQVDVMATGKGVADGATVKFTPGTTDATGAFTPGGESVALTPAGSGRFTAQIALSDAKDDPPPLPGKVEVTFHDGPAKSVTFDAEVHRGATSTLSVVEPWASLSSYWIHHRHYAVPTSFEEGALSSESELYFLADSGKHLSGSGYGRARVTVTARYNTKAPTIGAPSVSSSSFTIEKVGAPSASPPRTTKGAPTSLTPGTIVREFEVVGRPGGTGLSVDLKVAITGGDFATFGREKTFTVKLLTRVIQPPGSKDAPKGTTGADVAQLQYYLAQILALDRVPCYRSDDSDRDPVMVDGKYDTNANRLREAIWRFLYSYGQVDVKTQTGADVKRDVFASFTKDPQTHAMLLDPSLVDHANKPPPEVVAYASRTRAAWADKNAEWVVVDGPLVQRIADVLGSGAAIPYADFTLTAMAPFINVSSDSPVSVVKNVADAHVRGLPWDGYKVVGTLKVEGDGAKGDEDVLVSIPDKDVPYALKHAGATGSSFTAKFSEIAASGAGFELVWAKGGAQPKLTATLAGGGKHTWLVSQLQLFPPRDFFQSWPNEPGRDVLVVQLALTQVPRNPAAAKPGKSPPRPRGFVPPPAPPAKGKAATPSTTPAGTTAVDGVWSDGWSRALREYAAEWGLKGNSNAVVAALLDHATTGKARSP